MQSNLLLNILLCFVCTMLRRFGTLLRLLLGHPGVLLNALYSAHNTSNFISASTILTMFRTTIARTVAPAVARSLHSSAPARRTMTEAVKETAQDVNLKVGQTLAAGLEKGEKATKVVKENTGMAKEETKKGAETAQHRAHETKEDVKKQI